MSPLRLAGREEESLLEARRYGLRVAVKGGKVVIPAFIDYY
jgi:hypothetical protein